MGAIARAIAGPPGINGRANDSRNGVGGVARVAPGPTAARLRRPSRKDPPSEFRSALMPCRLLSAFRRCRGSRGRRAARDYAANQSLLVKLRGSESRDIPLFRERAKIPRKGERPEEGRKSSRRGLRAVAQIASPGRANPLSPAVGDPLGARRGEPLAARRYG